jgi:HD-GYP domain-containing protein (c-di-GMP phosphodiesterase class II)
VNLHQPDKDMLVPGNILPWDIVDSSGRMLLPKGLPIPDGTLAKQLWTRGYYLETLESTPASAPAPQASSWRLKPREPDLSVPKFFGPVSRYSFQLEEFYCEILTGKSERFTERFGEFVRLLQVQVAKDPDAFLASVELYDDSRYGTIHALHSGTLCELVALQSGMRADLRRTLLAAALTRDVGFLELQEELDLQRDPLTEEQQVSVRTHPVESARLLRGVGVQDTNWLSAVEQHHERLNGSGYPNELVGDKICEWARILGIADIYSAMTKPRAYRAAIHGPNVIHSIFQSRGSLVDESFTQLFIRVLGVYPPGILVRLSTDEIAVVTRRTENLKCPELRVVADASDKILQIYPLRELCDSGITIQEILPRATPVRDRLNHRQLWGEGSSTLRR